MRMRWHDAKAQPHTSNPCRVVLLQWPSHVVRKTSLELLHLLTRSTATQCARIVHCLTNFDVHRDRVMYISIIKLTCV